MTSPFDNMTVGSRMGKGELSASLTKFPKKKTPDSEHFGSSVNNSAELTADDLDSNLSNTKQRRENVERQQQ